MSPIVFERLTGDQGSRLLMKEITEHFKINVRDRGIIFDIDTPNDYNEAKVFHKKEN